MRDPTLTKRKTTAGSHIRAAHDSHIAHGSSLDENPPNGRTHRPAAEREETAGLPSERSTVSSPRRQSAGDELVERATRGLIRFERRRRRRIWFRRLFLVSLLAAALGGVAYLIADRLPPIDWQQYLKRLPLQRVLPVDSSALPEREMPEPQHRADAA